MKYYVIIRGIFFFFLFFIFICIKKYAVSLFLVHYFSYAVDPFVSQHIRQEIINYIDQIPKKQFLSFHELEQKIKKQFSFMHEVTLEYLAPGVVCVVCNVQKPLGLVNNKFVLTEQGYLHDSDIFLSIITKALPHITLPFFQKNITQSLVTIINNIEPVIFSQFNLSWEDETKIYLHEKKEKNFSIVFNKEQLPSKKLFNHCSAIKEELQKQYSGKNIKKNYVADIRFENQIVIWRQ